MYFTTLHYYLQNFWFGLFCMANSVNLFRMLVCLSACGSFWVFSFQILHLLFMLLFVLTEDRHSKSLKCQNLHFLIWGMCTTAGSLYHVYHSWKFISRVPQRAVYITCVPQRAVYIYIILYLYYIIFILYLYFVYRFLKFVSGVFVQCVEIIGCNERVDFIGVFF